MPVNGDLEMTFQPELASKLAVVPHHRKKKAVIRRETSECQPPIPRR
jgi:hypothetical protein